MEEKCCCNSIGKAIKNFFEKLDKKMEQKAKKQSCCSGEKKDNNSCCTK